jgi:hypothetical protein
MEADLELERQGRIQPERLSAEERDVILKWGRQAAVKNMETMYWFRIVELMMEGNTQEQAREKLYQNMLNSGHIEEAKALRTYQDIVHPLKTGKQQPGSNPKPPMPT